MVNHAMRTLANLLPETRVVECLALVAVAFPRCRFVSLDESKFHIPRPTHTIDDR